MTGATIKSVSSYIIPRSPALIMVLTAYSMLNKFCRWKSIVK